MRVGGRMVVVSLAHVSQGHSPGKGQISGRARFLFANDDESERRRAIIGMCFEISPTGGVVDDATNSTTIRHACE